MRDGGARWLLAGAAVLGVAFDVKILESLVALPGLAVLALLGFPGLAQARAEARRAGVVYVVVALAWLTARCSYPRHDRPWAIGSTNGSAWNAVFVFNGTERLGGKSPEPQTVYEPGTNIRSRHSPSATTSRSSPPRRPACSRGSGRCPASGSGSTARRAAARAFRRCCGACGAARRAMTAPASASDETTRGRTRSPCDAASEPQRRREARARQHDNAARRSRDGGTNRASGGCASPSRPDSACGC